jgi:hypothetical protein
MTPQQALNAVARTRFRPFKDGDWDCYAGCVSEKPLIGRHTPPGGSPVDVVVDGDVVNVIVADGVFYLFKLEEM